eukprot:6201511-Pleurochrysis_carterae.AAC.2
MLIMWGALTVVRSPLDRHGLAAKEQPKKSVRADANVWVVELSKSLATIPWQPTTLWTHEKQERCIKQLCGVDAIHPYYVGTGTAELLTGVATYDQDIDRHGYRVESRQTFAASGMQLYPHRIAVVKTLINSEDRRGTN